MIVLSDWQRDNILSPDIYWHAKLCSLRPCSVHSLRYHGDWNCLKYFWVFFCTVIIRCTKTFCSTCTQHCEKCVYLAKENDQCSIMYNLKNDQWCAVLKTLINFGRWKICEFFLELSSLLSFGMWRRVTGPNASEKLAASVIRYFNI
jgi:hypothetical protein